MTIAIIVPVLRRPQNVEPLLTSIAATTPDWRAYFVVDNDDEEELHALRVAKRNVTPGNLIVLTVTPGLNYGEKINEGWWAAEEPFGFTGADDLKFWPDWAETAMRHLDGNIGVVGTNDLGNIRTMTKGGHSTHSLFTRDYIDTDGGTFDMGPGVVMYHGYPHEFVDDEFVGTAKARGRYVHVQKSRVEHLHPNWKKSRRDEIYRYGQQQHLASRTVHEERRHLWST